MADDVSAAPRELRPPKDENMAPQLRRLPDGTPIWQWIAQRRIERGISVEALARSFGLSRQAMCNRLTGQVTITRRMLVELCAALEIDPVPELMPDPHPMRASEAADWLNRQLKWLDITKREAARAIGCHVSVVTGQLSGSIPMTLRIYTGLCSLIGAVPRLEEQFRAVTKRTTRSRLEATAIRLPPDPDAEAPAPVPIATPVMPAPASIDPEPVSTMPEPSAAAAPVDTTREAASVVYTVFRDGAPVGRFEEAQYALMMVSALIVRKGAAEISIRIEEGET